MRVRYARARDLPLTLPLSMSCVQVVITTSQSMGLPRDRVHGGASFGPCAGSPLDDMEMTNSSASVKDRIVPSSDSRTLLLSILMAAPGSVNGAQRSSALPPRPSPDSPPFCKWFFRTPL